MLAWKVAEYLRARLASGSDLPEVPACLLLSLMVFGGQFSPVALRAIWEALEQGKIHRLGSIPIVEAAYPEARVPLPLPPPVAAFLNTALGATLPEFDVAWKQLIPWLTSVLPGHVWPSQDDKSLVLFASLVQRWLRIEVAPHIFVCSDPLFGAAALSLTSVARGAYNRPRDYHGDVLLPSKTRPRKGPLAVELDELYDLVNKTADIKKRKGENTKRRRKIQEDLEAHHKTWSLSALGESVWTWLHWEVSQEENVKAILDVASLASYLSKLKDGLIKLEPETSLEDLTSEEWLEFLTTVEGDDSNKGLEQRRSIFRRLARFWRMRGASVPASVFADPGDEESKVSYSERSAATHITLAEGMAMDGLIRSRLEENPLLLNKALAMKAMLLAGPFRAGESTRIGLNDLDEEIPAVFIRTAGFSHLKRQSSRRTILMPESTIKQLSGLRDRASKITGHLEFLWLLDREEQRYADVDAVGRVLGEAQLLTTGEPQVRRHCFRASAVNREIFPELEPFLAAQRQGDSISQESTPSSNASWLRTCQAAALCGHAGVLSTLLYYFSAWPWAMYYELSASLRSLTLSDRLGVSLGYGNAATMRKVLSRLRHSDTLPLAGDWEIFAGRNQRIQVLPSVEQLLINSTPNQEPESTAPNEKKSSSLDVATTHFLALRLVGSEATVSLDESGIPQSIYPDLEKALTQYRAQLAMPITLTMKGQEACRRSLMSPMGTEWLGLISKFSNAEALSRIVASTSVPWSPPKNQPNVTIDTVIQTITKLIPRELTVSVLPASDRNDQALKIRLARISPHIVVKKASKRFFDGYKVSISHVDVQKRSPRTEGDLTSLLRIVCHARLANLLFIE